MKIVGERPLGPVMDGLADVRKVKVKEAFEKATVKAKAGPGPLRTAPPSSSSKEPQKKKAPVAAVRKENVPVISAPSSIVQDDPSPSASIDNKLGAPPAKLLAKKPAGLPPTAPAAPPVRKPSPAVASASKAAKGVASLAPTTLDAFKYKHTPEDADALAADIIPSGIATDFADANWKTRLAALDEMASWLESVIPELDAEVIVRFLAKRGWSERNFQVC